MGLLCWFVAAEKSKRRLAARCVYHHHYDVSPFFIPAVLSYFVLRSKEQLHRSAPVAAVPLVLIMLLLPFGVAQNLDGSLPDEASIGLLKPSLPVALLGSLALLFRGLRREGEALALPSAGASR